MSETASTEPAVTLGGDATLALPELEAPPDDPLGLLRAWMDAAVDRGVREPRAVSLATVGEDGCPSSRVVLVKGLDADGLVFTSHYGSAKGRELAVAPLAAITFFWRETLQQVNVAGPVKRLSAAESDALFAERPRAAQATTVASAQSRSLVSHAALRERASTVLGSEGEIARPAGWGGYRLRPARIEFWHGSPDRLHRRLRYERDGDGWHAARLQP